MIQATKLILKEGTIFDLYFYDGCVKRFDTKSLIGKVQDIDKLNNCELFLKGKLLGWGTLYWNDDISLSTETIYRMGEDVSKEYDDIEIVSFGYLVKDTRLSLDLTQEELAKKIGIDQADLSKIEKGNGNVTISTMKKIATGLGCNLDIKFNK